MRIFQRREGYKANKADWLDGRWSGMKSAKDLDDPRKGLTGVDIAKLKDIGLKLTKVPKDLHACTRPCSAFSMRAAR